MPWHEALRELLSAVYIPCPGSQRFEEHIPMARSGRNGCIETACSGGICRAGSGAVVATAVAGVGTRGSIAGRLQLVACGGLWTRPRYACSDCCRDAATRPAGHRNNCFFAHLHDTDSYGNAAMAGISSAHLLMCLCDDCSVPSAGNDVCAMATLPMDRQT